MGYSPWGRKESDMTEQLDFDFTPFTETISLSKFTFYKNEIDPETTPVPPPKFKLFFVTSLP